MRKLMGTIMALAAVAPGASAANAQDGDKSVNTAVAIAIVSTVVPVTIGVLGGTGERATNPRIVGVVGMLFGPTLGYAYAGTEGWRKGARLRSGVLGLGLAMSFAMSTNCAVNNTNGDQHHDSCGWRTGVQVATAAVMLASDIYDIYNLPRAMRYGREETSRLRVFPTLALDGRSTGVAVRVTF